MVHDPYVLLLDPDDSRGDTFAILEASVDPHTGVLRHYVLHLQEIRPRSKAVKIVEALNEHARRQRDL